MDDFWKKCSSCKKELHFSSIYYVCSVSTCNQKRTGLVFCSVACWDAHMPVARHRSSAGAVETIAPSREEHEKEMQTEIGSTNDSRSEHAPKRVIVRDGSSSRPAPSGVKADVLVVASKVKMYMKDMADMNTAASTMEELTERIILLCDKSIENARADGRKTVMDRDVPVIRYSDL